MTDVVHCEAPGCCEPGYEYDGPRSLERMATGDYRTTDQRLRNQAAMWTTPTSRDYRTGADLPHRTGADSLSLQVQKNATRGQPSSPPTRTLPLLSPLFTEWLMGLPFGWTALSASPRLAMPSYLSRQRGRLRALLANSGLGEA